MKNESNDELPSAKLINAATPVGTPQTLSKMIIMASLPPRPPGMKLIAPPNSTNTSQKAARSRPRSNFLANTRAASEDVRADV